jgi:hypothetical protein
MKCANVNFSRCLDFALYCVHRHIQYIHGKIDIENLKVHKNENFLASILNFVLFQC